MPKKVGFLYDKMLDRAFIRGVILDAAKGRKKRHDIAKVLADLDGYVDRAYELLATDSFVPSVPKERDIYDESSQKWRKIKMVPFWPDGVVHWLLVSAMKPVLMRGMHPWSCASVPGRGGIRIHRRIKTAMRSDPKGTKYACEMDVAQFYPSISPKRLIWALARKIKDKRFLKIVYDIMVSCGGGLAIGYYINQWLANYFLEPLDHFISSLPGVKYMTRHMDNITILGSNKKLLHKARRLIFDFMRRKLGLRMKRNWQVYPTAKRMVSAVGYRFARTHIIMRKRNFLRLTRQCRRVKKRVDAGRPIAFSQASGLLSRIGFLRHCNGQKAREKYVDPIGIKHLKEVVRYESKRRSRSRRAVLAGGAA